MGEGDERDRAVRRLPPAPARIRRRRDADPSVRARGRAPHRHDGRTAADGFGPENLQAMTTAVEQCVAVIRARAPAFTPRVGIVLGSGLGGYADAGRTRRDHPVRGPAGLSAARRRGSFRQAGARPHRRHAGRAAGGSRALLRAWPRRRDEGRRCARSRALGCGTLILTNSAGSLRREVEPGSVMLITDHINFTGQSPLFGETGNERFVDMVGAYDAACAAAPDRDRRRDRRDAARRASTCGSPARSSRRRPRSAPPRRSAPTRSACRRFPR